jgi:hypothetical protein
MALARCGHVRRCCGDVGDVMAQQGDEGERGAVARGGGGSGCVPPPFFRISRPGSGLGHWGIDSGVKGMSSGTARSSRSYGSGVATVGLVLRISAQNVFDIMPA